MIVKQAITFYNISNDKNYHQELTVGKTEIVVRLDRARPPHFSTSQLQLDWTEVVVVSHCQLFLSLGLSGWEQENIILNK